MNVFVFDPDAFGFLDDDSSIEEKRVNQPAVQVGWGYIIDTVNQAILESTVFITVTKRPKRNQHNRYNRVYRGQLVSIVERDLHIEIYSTNPTLPLERIPSYSVRPHMTCNGLIFVTEKACYALSCY